MCLQDNDRERSWYGLADLIPLTGEEGFDRMVHRFPYFPFLWQCATTGVASAP